jgi:hypothetical protein
VPAIELDKHERRALERICTSPQSVEAVAPEVRTKLEQYRLIEIVRNECRITLKGQLETLRQDFRDIQQTKHYALEIGETIKVHTTRRQYERSLRAREGGRLRRLLDRLIGR